MDAIWSNNCQAVLIASDGVGLRHLEAVVHIDDGLEARQDWLSSVSTTVQDKTRLVLDQSQDGCKDLSLNRVSVVRIAEM